MVEFGEIGQHRDRVGADIVLGAEGVERGRDIALHQVLEQFDDARPVGQAQHGAHLLGCDRAGTMGDRLVEDRQRVAHRSLGGAGDHCQRLIVDRRSPSCPAMPRMCSVSMLASTLLQVEALAARQHGDRDLADFGRRENELHMRRRLLERLQQAVEGLRRQHVDFVDDVDLVARRHRRIAHLLDDLADVVDAGVGGGVHLDDVDMAAFHDRLAVLAENREIDGGLVDVVSVL